MSSDNHQHDVKQRHDGPVEGQPQRRPYDPTPGLRKRTSILVGIVFVLLGLLMMFIAGDSAASIVSAHSCDSTGNTDNLLLNETGEFH
jgi:hypothetical protein